MSLSFDVNICNFLWTFFFWQEFERYMAKIDFRRKIISKIGRNSNRENSSRKYKNHISSVLSVKKWTMKQSMNSCENEFLMLSWIIKHSFFFFFFWDKDVATCNPFTQRLPTIECLLLFAGTLKLLSSLTRTRITFLLSFMAEAVALLPPWTTIKWKMCYQGWARKRDLPDIEECSLVFGRSLYGSDG